MKYGIWRHENALGNGAEHVINLAQAIKKNKDQSPEIFVENEWQRIMAMCIPNVSKNNIKFFPNLSSMEYKSPSWLGFDLNTDLKDIHMPGVYPFPLSYTAGWKNIDIKDEAPLVFPNNEYNNIHSLPKNAIVITLREYNTYSKRVEGSIAEPFRFVKIDTFHKLALYYADLGYNVVRIGSDKETEFPKHQNIIDFAKYKNRNLLDDLFLINNSKVFISCDSGIWPMAGGLKKKMVLTNVFSNEYTNWLPKETSRVMLKENGNDNRLEDIIRKVEEFL